MDTFNITTEYIELCQLLKLTGPKLSGGEAKHRILSGEVRVNGLVEHRKKCKIRPGQTVEFEGFSVRVDS